MSQETFALVNDKDQVVNHIVLDKETDNFEAVMSEQLSHWGCVRYVETTEDQPVIILDSSPEIWTTHKEETGFVLPEGYYSSSDTEVALQAPPLSKNPTDYDHEIVVIKGRVYPADSLLIKENAASRPNGWVLPEGEVEASLSDID